MVSVFAFAAHLALNQAKSITLTSPLAHSSVVLAELGKAAGVRMVPEGSVRQDYFFVHFTNTPLDVAMQRVARTLNATWVKGSDGYTLTRTHNQELADAAPTGELLRQVAKAVDEIKLEPMDFEKFRKLREKWDKEVSGKPTNLAPKDDDEESYEEPGNLLAKRVAKFMGAKELASVPCDETVWYCTNPTPRQRRLNSGVRPFLELFFQEQLQYLRVLQDKEAVDDFRTGGRPTDVSVSVMRLGASLYFDLYLSFANRPMQQVGLQIPQGDKSAIPSQLTKLKQPFAPGEEAKGFLVELNTKGSELVGPGGKPVWKWLLDRDDKRDFLDVAGTEILQQTAEALGKDVVALIPDESASCFVSSFAGQGDTLGAAWASAEDTWMPTTATTEDGYVSVRPLDPALARDRLDRLAVARFAARRAAKPDSLDSLAEFVASTRSNSAYDVGTSLVETALPKSDYEYQSYATSLIRVYAQMADFQRQAARSGGWQSLLAMLPFESQRAIDHYFFPENTAFDRGENVERPEPSFDSDRPTNRYASFFMGRGAPSGSTISVAINRTQKIMVKQSRGTDVSIAVSDPASAAHYAFRNADVDAEGNSVKVDGFAIGYVTDLEVRFLIPGVGIHTETISFPETSARDTFVPANQLPGELGRQLVQAIAELRLQIQENGGELPRIPPPQFVHR